MSKHRGTPRRSPLVPIAVTGTLLAAVLVPQISQAATSSAASNAAIVGLSQSVTSVSKDPQLAVSAAEAAADLGLGDLPNSDAEDYAVLRDNRGPGQLHHVVMERTFEGLPVIGGEAVVTTTETGEVLDTTTGLSESVELDDTTPAVTRQAAAGAARGLLTTVTSTERPRVAVFAGDGTPTLAWQVRVSGTLEGRPSVQNVYVDAETGEVITSDEQVRDATGYGHHNGTVNISTNGTAMQSTVVPGHYCGGQGGGYYTNSYGTFGNGSGTSLETACVDVMYGAEKMHAMLRDWAGRSGMTGSGRGAPARVGMNDANAYWNGSFANFGRNYAGTKQATAMDIVAHEFGHGVFQYSGADGGSGKESGGLNESTGDILGNVTEFYANNPNDPGDFLVGEEVSLGGRGEIRNMYNPSLLGDPNCYSSAIPSTEVHSGAGPQNHWFYLVAMGNRPSGSPASPICSGGPSSVTGIGIQKATRIFMSGLQRKTYPWTHAKARVATLQAARDLHPGSCTEFNTVRDAWLAVAVRPVAGEPTCAGSSNDFAISVQPGSGSVTAGNLLKATVATSTTAGSSQSVALYASGLPAGSSASFSPSTLSTGSASTMAISTSSTTPSGTYQVTVTATGSTTRTASFSLTVSGGGGGGGSTTIPDVSLSALQSHLAQFQSIASTYGNRRAGTSGYTASLNYVEQKLKAAGYQVTRNSCSSECTYPSDNLIADWPGGDTSRTLLFGAHLDGVGGGPGINDNASGSAAILETALTLARTNPAMKNHVRFAWWTDEEQGLNGSRSYVRSLSSTQRSSIAAYYNFDMVASPNGGYFINNISSTAAAPLREFYSALGLGPEENYEGAGRSDDYSFRQAGIATSGFAAGASSTKTASQAAKWGGTAGRAYDSCYHSSCDANPSNINLTVLDRAADAIAYVIWKGAVSTTTTPDPGPNPTPTTKPDPTPTPEPTTKPDPTIKPEPTATATPTPTPNPGPGVTLSNNNLVKTYDWLPVESWITSLHWPTVNKVTVDYDITHECMGQLSVDLVDPKGNVYPLEKQGENGPGCQKRAGSKQVSLDITPVSALGFWRLRVKDAGWPYAGQINKWSITLP